MLSYSGSRRFYAAVVSACAVVLFSAEPVFAQASVGDSSLTPFVIGFRPVVGGNGAVGGVSINAAGVISRAEVDDLGRLRKELLEAAKGVPKDLNRPSELRKISLARLEAEVARRREQKRPLTDDLLYLAGLQRIQYVFILPDQQDVILAGPAEGWTVGEDGSLVGASTGRPVLQLGDLVVALRVGEASFKTPITCSIHPTKEGLARVLRLLAAPGFRASQAAVKRLERTLGPQDVVIEGVPQSSRFARVLAAADFQMKRLAMGLEKPPIRGLPSYLDLLKSARERPESMTPRWWLAPNYEPLLRDAEGLAWEIRGQGVTTMTEDGFLAETGQIVGSGKENPLAKRWAESFTKKYEELSGELPVFADLRNCMDFAVVSALLAREDLKQKHGFELALLMDPKRIAVPEYHVPKQVASSASFLRTGKEWIITVSGGVEMTGWPVIEKQLEATRLSDVRRAALGDGTKFWWWD